MASEIISYEHALELFEYDKDSGILSWADKNDGKQRSTKALKALRNKRCGKRIGCKNKSGYLHFSYDRRHYAVHRIAWLLATGVHPVGQVDHTNHDKLDNRLENLRVVSASDNRRNQRDRNVTKSGVMGVYWDKRESRWYPRIKIEAGKPLHLGCTKDFFEACCRRKSAEIRYGFHENHGRVVNESRI